MLLSKLAICLTLLVCCRNVMNFVANINISQGRPSVATRLRRGEIFNDRFISNFPETERVKEFRNSVSI